MLRPKQVKIESITIPKKDKQPLGGSSVICNSFKPLSCLRPQCTKVVQCDKSMWQMWQYVTVKIWLFKKLLTSILGFFSPLSLIVYSDSMPGNPRRDH